MDTRRALCGEGGGRGCAGPGRGGRGGGRPALKGALFAGALQRQRAAAAPRLAPGGPSARACELPGRPGAVPARGGALGAGAAAFPGVARLGGLVPGRPRFPDSANPRGRPRRPLPATGCLSTWAQDALAGGPPLSPGTRSACMCVCVGLWPPLLGPPPRLNRPPPRSPRPSGYPGPQSLSIADFL